MPRGHSAPIRQARRNSSSEATTPRTAMIWGGEMWSAASFTKVSLTTKPAMETSMKSAARALSLSKGSRRIGCWRSVRQP